MSDYYQDQLAKLGGETQIKLKSDHGDTNWLNLNAESAQALADYLKAKMPGKATMETPEEREALAAVLNYCIDDKELEDFKDNPSQGHIYYIAYSIGLKAFSWPKSHLNYMGEIIEEAE